MENQVDSLGALYLLSSVRCRKILGAQARSWRIGVHLFIYLTAGEGVVRLDGALYKVRAFEMYLLVPGMIVEFPEQTNDLSYYLVLFSPLEIRKVRGKLTTVTSMPLSSLLMPGKISVGQSQQSLQVILRLATMCKDRTESGRFAARLELEQWLYGLMANAASHSVERDERIQKSLDHMHYHFKEKISVSQLAQLAGMPSPAYSSYFRKVMGQSPLEYLNEVRIEQAKKLFRQQHCRVKEAATQVGFSSEFYFSRVFQTVVGIPPKLYLNMEQPRVAVLSSLGFVQYLHALGIEPVYASDLLHYPGVEAHVHREHVARQWDKLRDAQPDLIIADEYHVEYREAFKKMANLVMMDYPVWDWQRNLLKLAGLLRKEEAADQALAGLTLRAEQVKQALAAHSGRRVTVLQINHHSVGILGTTGHPLNQLLYGELKLRSGRPAVDNSWRSEMVPEALPVIDTDVLFIYQHHVLAGSDHIYQRLIHTDSWSAIPAVQAGCVIPVGNWFAWSWTPAGRIAIMDRLLVGMSEAVR